MLWVDVELINSVEVDVEEVALDSAEVEMVLVVGLEFVVKSSLILVPVSVTVLVTGPKPGPDAVTVMVPELPIGIAYPPDADEMA